MHITRIKSTVQPLIKTTQARDQSGLNPGVVNS